MVGSTTVQDGDLCGGVSSGGKDGGGAGRYHLCEGGGDDGWTVREYQCHVGDGGGLLVMRGRLLGERRVAPSVRIDAHAHSKVGGKGLVDKEEQRS